MTASKVEKVGVRELETPVRVSSPLAASKKRKRKYRETSRRSHAAQEPPESPRERGQNPKLGLDRIRAPNTLRQSRLAVREGAIAGFPTTCGTLPSDRPPVLQPPRNAHFCAPRRGCPRGRPRPWHAGAGAQEPQKRSGGGPPGPAPSPDPQVEVLPRGARKISTLGKIGDFSNPSLTLA